MKKKHTVLTYSVMEERARKRQLYSTIDHHLDLTENGEFTVTQPAPFERVVPPFGRVVVGGLTDLAKRILDEAKEKKQ